MAARVLARRLGESEHIHFNRPGTVRQSGKRIAAVLIGGGHMLFVPVGSGYRGAGDRQASGFNRAVMFRSHERGDGDQGGQRTPEICVHAIQCHGMTHSRAHSAPGMLLSPGGCAPQIKLELFGKKGECASPVMAKIHDQAKSGRCPFEAR
jgi:hypothetical protein